MKIDTNTQSITFDSTGRTVDCYGGMIGLSADLNVGGGYDDTIHFPDLQATLTPAEQLELADAMINRWQRLRARAAAETWYRGKTYRSAFDYLEAVRPELIKRANAGVGLAYIPEAMACIEAWDAAVREFQRMLREVPMRDLQAMTQAMLSPPPMA